VSFDKTCGTAKTFTRFISGCMAENAGFVHIVNSPTPRSWESDIISIYLNLEDFVYVDDFLYRCFIG
jgi:hypothetical protein